MKKYVAIILFSLFAVPAFSHVNLLHPQAGSILEPGSVITIDWEIVIPHETENWDLFFSADGGVTWEPIVLDLPPETLDYLWTIPEQATTMGMVRIVQDNTGIDYSDESGFFTIAGNVGLEDPTPDAGLSVYPNPAFDRLYISLAEKVPGEVRITLHTASGVLIFSEKMHVVAEMRNRYFDISFLQPGLYLVTMESASGSGSRKIIVK